MSASAAEVQESHHQLLGAWSLMARKSPGGEVLELPDITLATSYLRMGCRPTARSLFLVKEPPPATPSR